MASESQLRDFLVLNAKPLFLGKGGGSPGITVFADYIHLRTRRGTDVLFMLPEIISVPVAGRFLKEVDSGGILRRSSFTRVATMSENWSLM